MQGKGKQRWRWRGVGCGISETEKNAGITNVNVYVHLIEDISGLDKIENLQIHENPLVCEKSYTILENYFREEDDT